MPAALSFYIPVTPKPPERILIRPPSNCSSAPSPSPMYLMARLCDPSSYTRTRRNSEEAIGTPLLNLIHHHIIISSHPSLSSSQFARLNLMKYLVTFDSITHAKFGANSERKSW